MSTSVSFSYGIVREILVGHGIGTKLHEDPQIPNFAQRRRGPKLKAGMTLAIQPMINMGRYDVEWLEDDWTVVAEDGSYSAHYENTVLITDGRTGDSYVGGIRYGRAVCNILSRTR